MIEAPASGVAPEARTDPTRVALNGWGRAHPKQAIASLYYTIASQRVLDHSVALQFVSPHAGAGTSLVASQFAAFAAQAQGGSALLIDCGLGGRVPLLTQAGQKRQPSLLEAFAADGRIDAALMAVEGTQGLYVAQLSSHTDAVFQVRPNLISAVLDQARSRYQFTALDTPAIEESAATLTFSRISDGVVLIVEADVTTAESAEIAVESLERSGGKVLGLVFNKRRLHMPRWLYRWL
jgi:Mrp family chromosome partitioning ATPase